jgi:hypothetical protein
MIDRVNSADARILSWLTPDGTFKLQSLLLPDLQKLSENEKSEPREPDAVQSRPWYVTVNKVELTGWGASIEDRTLPKPAQFSFNDITLTIDRTFSTPDKGFLTIFLSRLWCSKYCRSNS